MSNPVTPPGPIRNTARVLQSRQYARTSVGARTATKVRPHPCPGHLTATNWLVSGVGFKGVAPSGAVTFSIRKSGTAVGAFPWWRNP